MTGNTDIGRQLDLSVLSPFLKIGVALTTFQEWEEQLFFLVGYVEERLWWPIQSPNKGRKRKASS